MHGRQFGFTLIELLVTIAVIGILAALAFPSFKSTLQESRVSTTTNEMMASISLARIEAIRSTKPAAMCASSNGTSCGADWNAGWLVWNNTNDNDLVDGGETVVRYINAHPTLAVTGSVPILKFDSRGRISTAAAQNFTLRPSDCTPGVKYQRLVAVGAVGQAVVSQEPCP